MARQSRTIRAEEIEEIACRLLEELGFAGVGMQAIARAAKASNETLYRLYGDKMGLFRALITRNGARLWGTLDNADERGERGLVVLRAVGPVLLTMLLSDRSVALNRAAAADPSGALGRTLAEAGRNAASVKLNQIMADAQEAGELGRQRDGREVTPRELTELWLDLLTGSLQVRRVTGAIQPLTPEQIGLRNLRALDALVRLYPPALAG